MSRRPSGPAADSGQGPRVLPPASLPAEAAATARQPLPIPDTQTSRGSLERATHWLPGVLQPAAMLVAGLAKAAWTAAVPLAHLAYRLLAWSSPVLIWAFWKYINWYIMGLLAKAQRMLKWGLWILSWLTKAAPTA